MGVWDWLINSNNTELGVDQQINNEPVLPQQEQTVADQFGQWRAEKQAAQQRTEEINNLPVDMQIPQVVTPQTVEPVSVGDKFAAWKAQKQAESNPEPTTPFEKTGTILHKIGSTVTQPAMAALEAISYLDKPRGAIAGAVNAATSDGDILEGAKKGWNENTSWGEMFPEEFKQRNPYYAATLGGLAADIALDPMWLLPPAKVANMVGKASKATKFTDKVIEPAAKAFKESELGQKAIAFTEDVVGKNRIADEQFDFNAARATDQVEGQDYVDAIKELKKQYGDEANVLTKYIETPAKQDLSLKRAKEKLYAPELLDEYSLNNGNRIEDSILSASKDNTLVSRIANGEFTKQEAFDTLRNNKQEIPEYLLQDKQIAAKEVGQAIPETVYRDQVLQSIPDENLRKAIQTIGDKFVDLNKRYSDDLLKTGRLSDEQYVRFMDGEHLRRSFEQYENPEKFLEAVRKNGTQEEYRRIYQALAASKAPGAQGYGAAHRVQMKDFIGRQNLSEDTMKKLGLITDPEYRIMDTINRGSKTLREDEFLKRVADTWGKTADEAADLSRTLPERRRYIPIPDGKGYGSLAGKWVPKDIANEVMKTTGTKPENINKTWQKMVSWFKVEKLANPASVMRNLYSGLPMANAYGKVPIDAMPKYMGKAFQAMRVGNANPLMREVKSTGILGNEWSKQELGNILTGDAKRQFKEANGIKKVPAAIKIGAEKGMEWFGKPDEFWRTVVYAYHRDSGKTVKEAAKIANDALLDYSKVPDWVSTLSKSGAVPFIKFPYLSTQQAAKALYNRPGTVTKYTKAQNQVNNEDREQIMPEYMKSRTLLPIGNGTRIVNGKEQKVQNNIDLSYILPFASDVNFGNPIIDAAQLYRTGKNGIGQQVIKPGMTPEEKAKEWGKWAINSLGPAAPIIPGNYAWEKLQNGLEGKTDSKGRQYDPATAILQTLGGIKNVPISIEEIGQQKIKSIEFEQKSVKSMMNQITKDKSLSNEEKADRLKSHARQYQELKRQEKEVKAAYKREKERASK